MKVISADQVSKSYRLGQIGASALHEDLSRLWAKFRSKPDPYSKVDSNIDARLIGSTFHALDNVTFDVNAGEVLGIIGKNGAGKSTMLKLLSRVTAPTRGIIKLRGRLASLLEVGTGFHPELTGKENIFLNGAILGMTRNEIRRKLDEIIWFSEMERFIDTPVKRYSSGMYVRLAFAVAAHLDPELLIIDEVLAVGDASFQRKCLGRVGKVASEGRTVLFVSHNMVAVQSLCTRCLLLESGRLAFDGAPSQAISQYMKDFLDKGAARIWSDITMAPGTQDVRVTAIHISPDSSSDDGTITMQTPITIQTEYQVFKPSMQMHITYHLMNESGITVLTTGAPSQLHDDGVYRSSFTIPNCLLNCGQYHLNMFAFESKKLLFREEAIASFTVVDINRRFGSYMEREPGVIQPMLPWHVIKAVQ
jgi:lipopolysaccharide transport system ATP-binding protein